MKNNVYVRSKRSIKNITLLRIVLLLPLIIYGVYKNGIYLYINKYTNILGLFKPLVFILIGALIGAIVNILYEYIIKRNKDKLIDVIFSSFHVEYGMLLGCIASLNTNLIIYSSVIFVVFIISKFLKNRINTICFIFIIIYVLQYYLFGGFSYLNAYDTSRVFNFDFMDYMVGRGEGGIATTHIILLIISLLGITITNNNKTNISISAIVTSLAIFSIYAIISNNNVGTILLQNSYIFLFTYVATDYVTSSYTPNGQVIFGILVGCITFGLYFVNPILAPYISIIIVSLLNNLIDRVTNKLNNNTK
ncbi:MAG: RnfABCDGE type electron transport complex subunit D [Bacilli bacterium]|nr:RnfABCDGE type electron transport complex subunit D [Bacilli bacterium]